MFRISGTIAGLAVGLWAITATASAQTPAAPAAPAPSPMPASVATAPPVFIPTPIIAGPGCGPNGCGAQAGCSGPTQGPVGKGPCSSCGQRLYPVFDNRYIRQFCKPTINPGSCFGHYKTQWSAWGDACPNWGGQGYMAGATVQNPLDGIPANRTDMIPPIGPTPKDSLPNPKPVPMPESTVPPAKDPPKIPPTVPPIVPPPKTGNDLGLAIPPVPVLETSK